MSERYLAHHGIKGQKWGVRRYQNPDGTLTEAGKQRQIKDERKELDNQRSSMSDKELDDTINRLKKEKQLHELVNPGETYVKSILSDAGKRVFTTAIAGAGIFAAKTFINKLFKQQKFDNEADLDKAIDMLRKQKQFDELNNATLFELANAVFNGGAKKK